MDKDDEHIYYWAWSEKDNPNAYHTSPYDKLYRVYRALHNVVKDPPITEVMSRREAQEYCERIAKLTGGRVLS